MAYDFCLIRVPLTLECWRWGYKIHMRRYLARAMNNVRNQNKITSFHPPISSYLIQNNASTTTRNVRSRKLGIELNSHRSIDLNIWRFWNRLYWKVFFGDILKIEENFLIWISRDKEWKIKPLRQEKKHLKLSKKNYIFNKEALIKLPWEVLDKYLRVCLYMMFICLE